LKPRIILIHDSLEVHQTIVAKFCNDLQLAAKGVCVKFLESSMYGDLFLIRISVFIQGVRDFNDGARAWAKNIRKNPT